MKDELIKAIKAAAIATKRAAEAPTPHADMVLKLSQAVLNATHALSMVLTFKEPNG